MPDNYRQFLHHLAADVSHYGGLLKSRSFLRRAIFGKPEVYVLGLHRVLTQEQLNRTNSLPGMILKETTFVAMLEYIQTRCETISLSAFLGTKANVAPARPRFLFTFDDGWRDNYIVAHPWLKKFEVPAVLFVSVGAVESQQPFWIERLVRTWKEPNKGALQSKLQNLLPLKGRICDLDDGVERLKHLPSRTREQILRELLGTTIGNVEQEAADQMLTWDQVIEMGRDGIEIGSHTVTHPLLTYENEHTVEEELSASKTVLEQKLGHKILAFAYPNGDANEAVARQVRRAGYGCAFVTRDTGISEDCGRFAIQRVTLHDGNVTGRDGKFSPAVFNLTLARSG